MFDRQLARWGRWVHRRRFLVCAVFLVAVAASGLYGLDLGSRLAQGGWFDEHSESVAASQLADRTFGRDTDADVIIVYTAPPGGTVDDPPVRAAVTASLAELRARYPDRIQKIDSYFDGSMMGRFADASRTHAFASVGLRGADTESVNNYLAIEDALRGGCTGATAHTPAAHGPVDAAGVRRRPGAGPAVRRCSWRVCNR